MIEKIDIKQYRKLKDIEFSFNKGVNILSGTNGTCKTSLLHIISNSFQAINKSCEWVNDEKCLDCIRNINSIINPKIESLTRGDKEHTDPAPALKGALYTTKLFNGKETPFRSHNSKLQTRYAVKPYYKPGSGEKLPFLPIIYLGLFRLFPYGEYQDDDRVKKISKKLPTQYQEEIAVLYKNFTGITIEYASQQKMGDIKTRAEFSTDYDGIDSNTISAGEDNLYIILSALVSLKYYFENIESQNEVESILLIDELDATLHPAYQIKLLYLFLDYAERFKIQIFFTTHSMTLLEEALSKSNCNIIYLIDNIDSVFQMQDADIYKIKVHLYQKAKDDIYYPRRIPVFTEDQEARLFLDAILDYYAELDVDGFKKVKSFFHYVEASIGAENLNGIFKDNQLLRSTIRSICILDGDHAESQDLNNHTLALPGNKSPENLIFDFSKHLYDNDAMFWQDDFLVKQGMTKIWYRDNLLNDIEALEQKIAQLTAEGKSIKGVRRSGNKKIFEKHSKFLTALFKYWVRRPENQTVMQAFYNDLWILFVKVAEFHGINPKDWGERILLQTEIERV